MILVGYWLDSTCCVAGAMYSDVSSEAVRLEDWRTYLAASVHRNGFNDIALGPEAKRILLYVHAGPRSLSCRPSVLDACCL